MREEGDRETLNAFKDQMRRRVLKQKSGRQGGTALNAFKKAFALDHLAPSSLIAHGQESNFQTNSFSSQCK